jgi:competence ComEA-like helix-hairpin-helix protein
MSSRPWVFPARFVAAAAVLLTITIAVPSAGRQTPQSKPPAAAAADVEDEDAFAAATEPVIERVCVQCHTVENFTKRRRTAKEWNDVVNAMAGRGAVATDEDFKHIKRYMTRYYGLVRINTAPAEEISAVLGLSPKAAAAVVEYRKAHGKFTDLAGVEQVEGIDKAKIEDQPDAISFN